MPELPNRDQLDDELAAILAALLADQGQWLLTLLGDPPDARNVPAAYWEHLRGELRSTLITQLSNVYQMGSLAQAGNFHVDDDAALALLLDGDSAAALIWASEHVDDLLDKFIENSKKMASEAVQAYHVEHHDLALLGAGLLVAFGSSRADSLAITSITSANTAGERRVARDFARINSIRVEAEWQTERDRRVCDRCSPLQGKPQPVWLEVAPNGPPLHPRCVLPGQIVHAPGRTVACAKSLYDGPCVEITLGNGSRLSVTANHPILTDQGWIAAQFVHEGHHCFHSVAADRIAAFVSPDDQDVPAVIEEVFSAWHKTSGMATESVPLSAEDFHGDARFIDGNVDVVNANGFLWGDRQAAAREPRGEKTFVRRRVRQGAFAADGVIDSLLVGNRRAAHGGVCLRQHRFPHFGRGMLPTCEHGLGYAARCDAGTLESLAECHAAYADFDGERLFCFASDVAGNQSINARNVYPQSSRRIGPAYYHANRPQLPLEGLSGDANLARQFLRRFSGLISRSPVIKIRQFKFSGHVYDLQVDPTELYFCNGTIVHNCRCFLVYSAVRDRLANVG